MWCWMHFLYCRLKSPFCAGMTVGKVGQRKVVFRLRATVLEKIAGIYIFVYMTF